MMTNNIMNTIKVFGHEYDWDLDTTMICLMILQIIVVILMVVIFAIIIRKVMKIRKQIKEASLQEQTAKPVEEYRKLINITLDTDMVQKEFFTGDKFNSEGLIVIAHYNKAPFTELIVDYELQEPDLSVEGKPTAIVTYRGLEAAYAISVLQGATPVVEETTPVTQTEETSTTVVEENVPVEQVEEVEDNVAVTNEEPVTEVASEEEVTDKPVVMVNTSNQTHHNKRRYRRIILVKRKKY